MKNPAHGHTASLVFVCLLLLSGCADLAQRYDDLKEPKVSLAGLAIKKLDLLSPSLLVRLRLENPNDVPLDLDGADAALALNGQPVATGVSLSPLSLARLGTSTMDVEVNANTLGVLQQLLSLQGKDSVDYQLTGHLNVLNWLGPLGRIPFDLRGAVDPDTLLRGAESLAR